MGLAHSLLGLAGLRTGPPRGDPTVPPHDGSQVWAPGDIWKTIFAFCREYTPAFRCVCWAWHDALDPPELERPWSWYVFLMEHHHERLLGWYLAPWGGVAPRLWIAKALDALAGKGDLEGMQRAIQDNPESGLSPPLFAAAKAGEVDTARWLLEQRRISSEPSPEEEDNLICATILGGKVEGLQMLRSTRYDGGTRNFRPWAMHAAAKSGSVKMARHVWAARDPAIPVAWDNVLGEAAAAGKTKTMVYAKRVGVTATGKNLALARAASGGHLKAMALAKRWGATNYHGALQEAITGGHVGAMKLARLYGGKVTARTCFSDPLYRLAWKGLVEPIRLTLRWAADDCPHSLSKAFFGALLIEAMTGGPLPSYTTRNDRRSIIRLLQEYGVSEWDEALCAAAALGRIKEAELLIELGATDLEGALVNAAGHGRPKTMGFLRARGGRNNYKALEAAHGLTECYGGPGWRKGSHEAAQLIASWAGVALKDLEGFPLLPPEIEAKVRDCAIEDLPPIDARPPKCYLPWTGSPRAED